MDEAGPVAQLPGMHCFGGGQHQGSFGPIAIYIPGKLTINLLYMDRSLAPRHPYPRLLGQPGSRARVQGPQRVFRT